MKNSKKRKFLIVPAFFLVLLTSLILYIIYNPLSESDVSLNVFEERWLASNKNKVINIYLPVDVPLATKDGKGVSFDFISYLEEKTDLEFNKNSYIKTDEISDEENNFVLLEANEQETDQQLVFLTDNYVVLSNESVGLKKVSSLTGKVGVLENDYKLIENYILNENLILNKYSQSNDMFSALDNEEVQYLILSKVLYLDKIIEKNYNVINVLNDLSRKYVLSLGKNDKDLNNIINKFYQKWQTEELIKSYNKELFDLYALIKQIDDKTKTEFISKRYVYGYLETIPYDRFSKNELLGISGEYLNNFMDFSKVEFSFKGYNNSKELNEAFLSGEVDFAFNYYDLKKINGKNTNDIVYSDYYILTKKNNVVIDTLKSLKKEAYLIEGTKLAKEIKDNSNFLVKEVKKPSDLKDKEIIIVDNNTYIYYKDKVFNEYFIAYSGKLDENYGYIVNNKESNDMFFNIFNYYISSVNHEKYKYIGINNLTDKRIEFDLSFLWLYVILFPLTLFMILYFLKQRSKKQKMRTDMKLKYIDPLTSIKNRYYLNCNMCKWQENNTFPQAIIIVNINRLKDINDVYGHEAGDNVIKEAANILIKNQVDRSDIVRTDGNEFLIYLLSYDEQFVSSYAKKISKLLKDLPHENGATTGYSMIEDDMKTIEDAINEAILDMATNRELRQNNES